MKANILLTSFQTWLPHHQSNSSDDLLALIEQEPSQITDLDLNFLRKLPVHTEQASKEAIATIETLKPDQIICCGMAESRQKLTLESNATVNGKRLHTSVNLEKLVSKLSATEISHDAGKFVCEGLYHQILSHLQRFQLPSSCLFIHVPVLKPDNISVILADFLTILQELAVKKF